MSEVDTPAGGTTPTVDTPTPAQESVTLSKEDHAKLVADAAELERARAQQASADREAARLKRILDGRGSESKGRFNKPAPKATPSPEDEDAYVAEQERKAERYLVSIALDPKYRDLLDSDGTLRDLLTRNPLGALPILANDAVDAEDANELVRAELDKRLASFQAGKPAAPTQEPEKKVETPQTPPAGGVNTSSDQVDSAKEEARKNPNTERALAGMIAAGLKQIPGK
jgi:hypothetical protein